MRRQTFSVTDYGGSLDENYLKSSTHKDCLTHSTSRSVDHDDDPPLTASGSPMDCIDSVTDQQPSNCDTCTTSLKSACQVSVVLCSVRVLLMIWIRILAGMRSLHFQFYHLINISTLPYGVS